MSSELKTPIPVAPAPQAASRANSRTAEERRTNRRHAVHTKANLCLIGTGILMPGQILNLSEGGCRLRTEVPFLAGSFVRVEAEFFLRGLPFRIAGVSQAILDDKTIGIRFVEMSERRRAQLVELMAEIAEAERIR